MKNTVTMTRRRLKQRGKQTGITRIEEDFSEGTFVLGRISHKEV